MTIRTRRRDIAAQRKIYHLFTEERLDRQHPETGYRPYSRVSTVQNGQVFKAGSDIFTDVVNEPMYTRDCRFRWKRCSRQWDLVPEAELSATVVRSGILDPYWARRRTWTTTGGDSIFGSSGSFVKANVPTVSTPIQELWDGIWTQVDLNTSEAVMAYSGILQAVPMLGGLLKANKILKEVFTWATKSLRKKPLREVLKTAISADFVNRFVVQTTLQDLRMVNDSMDYVLRVLNTARERNNHPTPLKTQIGGSKNLSTTLRDSTSWITQEGAGSGTYQVKYYGKTSIDQEWSDTLYVLLDVSYNLAAVDPIRLWAQRVGLTRPLDSVWDLVPFSFVVDYFLRTGDLISHLSDQMSSLEGLKGKVLDISGAWLTSTRKKVGRFTATSCDCYPSLGASDTIEYEGEYRVSSGTFNRYPVNMLAQSGFWDKGGIWSPSLSSTRWRTLAQLFIQPKLR